MNKLNHVAFIMDGNGRWGKNKNKSRNFGHLKGVETVEKIVKASLKLRIPMITFYVFSTENWRRPKTEIRFLFNLIGSYFKKEINNVIKNGIKINILGRTSSFSTPLKSVLRDTVKKTTKNKKLVVNLALNYGSKNEIKNAFIKLKKSRSKISEAKISKNLYTSKMHDPDILIRTGGQRRLSNFMLWQLAYSELYFLDKLWPDFNSNDLRKIIKNYRSVKRNFGKV
ncbi:MAG: di-trans,poly-cis-decaprenylcistransferase [Pelagibacterales bacterium MED-G40]|nr:MAG: di-trans,poly-cis-decaprenylcistransferase [Pelagibacterales bacterium MED-G40]|tara:strand:- start:445 stop:1122 length:678 start_codon:yes stop_codon:yes gene_type:complete